MDIRNKSKKKKREREIKLALPLPAENMKAPGPSSNHNKLHASYNKEHYNNLCVISIHLLMSTKCFQCRSCTL